ncbi:hypothetical protein [Nostoc sp. LEGE 12447]|nr:hypothetical protein [Nostoc sp. LEGE 12447]
MHPTKAAPGVDTIRLCITRRRSLAVLERKGDRTILKFSYL